MLATVHGEGMERAGKDWTPEDQHKFKARHHPSSSINEKWQHGDASLCMCV